MASNIVKNLKLLKKLSQQQSDMLRVEMQSCLGQIDQLNACVQTLIEECHREEEFSAQPEHVETTVSLDAYRERQKQEQVKISNLIEDAEKSYDGLHEQLAELYSEQKSYEITLDDLNKKELEREKQIELQFFDEVSVQRWRNK